MPSSAFRRLPPGRPPIPPAPAPVQTAPALAPAAGTSPRREPAAGTSRAERRSTMASHDPEVSLPARAALAPSRASRPLDLAGTGDLEAEDQDAGDGSKQG